VKSTFFGTDLSAPATPPPLPQTRDADLEAGCKYRLIEVGQGGTFLEIHGKSRDPAIMEWGLDYLLKKFTNHWGKRPHLIVAHGAQWSRDSKRDFKVVGGKVVKNGFPGRHGPSVRYK
jgi:hypothetical protein